MVFDILLPVLSIAGLALLFGGLLGFAGKKFHVDVDPKVEQIQNVLPGANCGGCGLPGCGVFADAVAKGTADYSGCPVAGSDAAIQIAAIMGIEASVSERKVAFIKCNGVDDNVKRNYIYSGPTSCISASQLALGGSKACAYACLGLESCKNACPFDAVNMVDGIAEIDTVKCVACGKCVDACPKNLIDMVYDKAKIRVMCNSRDKGKTVKDNCRAGCIACTLCQKNCSEEAIVIENNIAIIDYDKCTLCGVCVDKCPTKSIKVLS
ncbi:MAG: RnfABCDGE type electron transport complex subunit B [Clostridiales bacterium]|nr:RnfABCDGE type electron transport complex subunit B [Clostridiales bacterium]